MKKIIIIIAGGVFLFVGAGWFGWKYIYPDYKFWEFTQRYNEFEQSFNAFMKNDTFGGKTPQETYALYIEALKKGDTDSASRYFYWERQVGEKTKLDDLKSRGELAGYIAGLPKWEELKEEEYWDVDGRRYSYKFIQQEDVEYFDKLLGEKDIIKAGEYKSFIDFQLNKSANIWKIYSL